MGNQDIKLSFDKSVATEEDVIKLFQKALEAIKVVKEQLEAQMGANHGELSTQSQTSFASLTALQKKVTDIEQSIPTETKVTANTEKALKALSEEINKVKLLIPTLPDLAPLEAKISLVESKIPTVEKITAQGMRDKLETLKNEERLDSAAINNLPNFTVSRDAPDNPEIGDIWMKL